jgi:hypothetical protein
MANCQKNSVAGRTDEETRKGGGALANGEQRRKIRCHLQQFASNFNILNDFSPEK